MILYAVYAASQTAITLNDLIQLCKLCCEVDTRFEQLADSCIELTPYGVQVRYPSNLELDESDAVCALKEPVCGCARRMLRWDYIPA